MHVAIIPDGNRRFAKRNGLTIEEAYKIGIEKIRDVVEWVKDTDVKEMTLWGFSTENFNRDEKEKETIWTLLGATLDKIINEYKKSDDKRKEQVKISFHGMLEKLPNHIEKKCLELMDVTNNNGPYKLNILLAYGGRYEIINAINNAIKQKQKIDFIEEGDIEKNLMVKTPADLIIRTGGEKRLSGYLLWQSAYSELFFSDKLWPEFEKEDLLLALDDYTKRERRFGK
ncbi:MAG: polyprenyl diphosphate synthase [Candidatus Anstonellales archaeon]